MSSPPDDQQIKKMLKLRTTEELKGFQKKLRGIDTPQAWTIRFYLVQELSYRHISSLRRK